jgi:hypothetical protein
MTGREEAFPPGVPGGGLKHWRIWDDAPDGPPLLLGLVWEANAAAALARGWALFPGADPTALRVERVPAAGEDRRDG